MSQSFLQNIGAPGVQQNYLQAAPPKPAAPTPKQKPSGWQQGIDAQRRAMQTGSQLPAGPGPRVADDGQFRGPAYPGPGTPQNMSLYDWQQMTGIYDAPVDSKNDAWTPTGYGVPGVPRELQPGYGLTDAYGRGVYGKDGKVQPPAGGSADGLVEENNGGGNGRNSSRKNALGVEQKGTQMSPKFDLSGIANFNGPSFPGMGGYNKITDNYVSSDSRTEKPQNMSSNDAAILYAQGNGGLDDLKPGATNDEAILHAQGNGSLDGFKPGGRFAGPPTATTGQDDPNTKPSQFDQEMEFGGPDPASYASRPGNSREEIARRATFLDSSGDSLVAMRNVAAGMGMGNGFANVDGEGIAMSQSDRRAILQAAPGETQKFKDDWMKAKMAERSAKAEAEVGAETPSEEQNPVVVTGMGAQTDVNSGMSVGNQQNQLNSEAFNADGPNYEGAAATQAVNKQKFDPSKFYLK